MTITSLSEASLAELTLLTLQLWPECQYAEAYRNAEKLLSPPKDAVFLCWVPEGGYTAFIQLSLRYDYVEGTEPGGVLPEGIGVMGRKVASCLQPNGIMGILNIL